MARRNSTTQEEAPEMTTATETAIDFAALAGSVEDAQDRDSIQREGGAGRPKEVNPFEAKVIQAREEGNKVKEVTVPTSVEGKVVSYLRRAAAENGYGLRLRVTNHNADGTCRIVFQPADKKNIGDKVECPVCHSEVSTTGDKKIRTHGPRDLRCTGSGKPIPSNVA